MESRCEKRHSILECELDGVKVMDALDGEG